MVKRILLLMVLLTFGNSRSFACALDNEIELRNKVCIMTYSESLKELTIMTGAMHEAISNLSETGGMKISEIEKGSVDRVPGVTTWLAALKMSRDKCKLGDDDINWLSSNVEYGYVEQQTDAQYREAVSKLKRDWIEKTLFNFWKWKEIERRNHCGASKIAARSQKWTVLLTDPCHWHEKSNTCACPKC